MESTPELSDKIAIVSGSSRGIGKNIAYRLLENGATVYLTGRSGTSLEKTYLEYLEKFAGRVFKFQGDLIQTDTIQELFTFIMKNSGKIDIVVANIGSGRSQMGWDIPDALWTESMEINFFSAVRLSRESIKRMTAQKKGVVIFISSIAGIESIAAPVPYSCSKAALLSYMKNTSAIIAEYGIRTNAISPGNIYFAGGTWERKIQENPDIIERYIMENVPMQKFGTPDDIARLVCYLASENASFITGANFVVDGGQTRRI
jgi:3-oxoacyl-[acyl-carrier protein] reductase